MNEPGAIGPFGELLSPAERRQFVGLARPTTYERGDVLFHQGDVTRHAVLIESGAVKIVVRRPDGAYMSLAVRGPNDLVGEMAAFDGSPRSAGAVAMSRVDVHVIDAPAFEAFVRANSNVAWMLLHPWRNGSATPTSGG